MKLAATLVALTVAAAPALAQAPELAPPGTSKKLPEPPAKLPKVSGDKTKNLDFLFGAFGAADIMFAPVCTRIVTYSLPVARFATGYVEAVLNHPFMQDWIAAAQEEEWVIEKFEQPAGEA